MRWLKDEKGLSFGDYNDLWEWSVTDLEGFWASVWQYCGIEASKPYERVLAKREMPGAEWFSGAELNYAEHILRHAADRQDEPAILHQSEVRPLGEVSWGELRERTAELAAGLKQIEPEILIAVDGYRYGGKNYDRLDVVARLQQEIPTLQRTVVLPYLSEDPDTSTLENVVMWDELLAWHTGAELSF